LVYIITGEKRTRFWIYSPEKNRRRGPPRVRINRLFAAEVGDQGGDEEEEKIAIRFEI
jgi:hypothetical protein